ncbi:serine protease [Dyella solisilvae]|uniref:Serine protease n=1 Tax=Dyella solisilvae TaxID=1920168 RepID=A0A370K7H7_9GAMM|nr:S8 family serine peptidase [Dyella solisilvae]RDI97990.1 serine protease [Dyella solisilvae]
MKRILTILSLMMVMATLGACAPARPTAPSVSATQGPTVDVAAMDTSRDIVLAVANPMDPPAMHAGSNLVGYASAGHYGASQRAISTLDALKSRYGIHEVTGWPIKTLDLYCIVLEPPPGMSRDAMLATLSRDERVQLAQPLQDYKVYSDAARDAHHYNDPYAELQRGFVETDAALAHHFSQGAGVHVAIIDTGVDMMHPDLRDNIREARNLVDDDVAAFNRDSHGTEVAGIITAEGDNHQGIVGMAPHAELSIYKACWYARAPGDGAHCNSFTLAKALAAVMDTDARIINLSLGGPADPLLNRLLAQLLQQGRIVVAALPPKGNGIGFPSALPGVIVVGASGGPAATPGMLSAPGKDILTTQPGGGYDFTSGSSMAAAHVSGIAALLLAIAPRLDGAKVNELLQRSSGSTHGVEEVNAASAVTALRAQQLAAH